TGDEATLAIDLAVIHPRAKLARMCLIDAGDFARFKIEEVKPRSKRYHRAAFFAQCHRPYRFRDLPRLAVASFDVGAVHRRPIGVDPIEPLFLDVPQRAFAKGFFTIAEDLYSQHLK